METALPPGPRRPLLDTARLYRDPYGMPLALHRKFGDPCSVRTLFGPMVLVGSADGIRDVFTADPRHFDVLSARVVATVIGEHSLLVLSGDKHKRERKLLQPPFHAARMRAYGRLIQRIAAEHAGAWPARGPIDINASTRAMSLEVILEAVFGVVEPARKQVLAAALHAVADTVKPTFMFFPRLRTGLGARLSGWNRFMQARARVDAILDEEIARRRAQPEPREDILQLLLDARYDDGEPMCQAALRDQLLTLLSAGHETTAVAIAWALDLLHRHPEVLERLRAELAAASDEPEQVAQLPYLDAVCNETLRLYPLIASVTRLLAEPLEVCGHRLPAGVAVGASMVAAHRREEVFPEPEAFRPERFVGRRYSPFEFLPFGGGTRRCLGAALAVYELKLIVATIVGAHRLALVRPEPPRVVLKAAFIAPARAVELARAA